MKLISFGVTLYLMSNAHEALAQSNSAPKQSRREMEDAENSSQENRKKITVSLGAEIYFGFGYVVGYQLKPDLTLELWRENSSPLRLFTPCGSSEFDLTFTGARGRFYFGNSFNVSGYSYYKREKWTCGSRHDVTIDSNGNRIEDTVVSSLDRDYASVGIGFSLGNRWQWENFYIGGEWFGLGVDTVVKNYHTNKPSDGGKIILSRLTIGASF